MFIFSDNEIRIWFWLLGFIKVKDMSDSNESASGSMYSLDDIYDDARSPLPEGGLNFILVFVVGNIAVSLNKKKQIFSLINRNKRWSN